MSGSKKPAIDGQLIFLCGGDEALYKECETAFDIMGKAHYFLGDVGTGARMKCASMFWRCVLFHNRCTCVLRLSGVLMCVA